MLILDRIPSRPCPIPTSRIVLTCNPEHARLGSIDDAEQSWKRAVQKVQAASALHGGRLEELDEDDDEGPPPVLEMEFTVVDMGLHFVEVDQTPIEDDRVRATSTGFYCHVVRC